MASVWLWLLSALPSFVAMVHAGSGSADGGSAREPRSAGKGYAEAREQLIVELYVRNLKQSVPFYVALGFTICREEPGFVELGWDDSRLYLEQIPAQPDPPQTLVANIRILVPDVDRFWSKCGEMNLTVVKEIGDRDYGLRDFTVVSPDGIGLRFASPLPGR